MHPERSFGWNHGRMTDLTVLELAFPVQLHILRHGRARIHIGRAGRSDIYLGELDELSELSDTTLELDELSELNDTSLELNELKMELVQLLGEMGLFSPKKSS